jgi:DNA-directed RNA polymerase subunit RPC12/RpoP
MLPLTSKTYVCPDCRQRVEVKIAADLIYCARCRQSMILAKGQVETLFELPQNTKHLTDIQKT